MTRRLTFDRLATTEDSADPVIHAELPDTASYANIIYCGSLDPAELRVAHVASRRQGDMAVILDEVVEQTGVTLVRFLTPLDELKDDGATNLMDRLDGFTEATETVTHDGDELEVESYVGEWRLDRG